MLYLPVRAIEAFLTSARVAVNDEIQAHAALPPGEHWLGCLLGSTANLLGSTANLLGSTANLLGSTANLLGSTANLLGSTANLLGSTANLLGSTAIRLGSTANLLLSRNDKFFAFAQEWKPDS